MPQLVPQQPPPADYYAANVRRVLDHVAGHHQDLLGPEPRAHARSLLAATPAAQRLYARLLTRKGPWIREDKLNYPEVADTSAALAELAHLNLVVRNGPAPASGSRTSRAASSARSENRRRHSRSIGLASCRLKTARSSMLSAGVSTTSWN